MLLVLILVATGTYFVATGPVDIPRLARLVEERFAERGIPVSIQSAAVDLTFSNEVSVTFENSAIGGENAQGFMLTIPRVTIPLELWGLFSGDVRLNSFTLERAHLAVSSLDSDRDVPEMERLIEEADRVSRRILDEFDARGLSFVEIVDGEITLHTEVERRISGIDARLSVGERNGLLLEADVAGRFGSWQVELRRMTDPDSGERIISASSSPLTLGEFLAPERDLIPGRGLGVPFQPRFEGRLSEEGTFKSARFNTEVSGGWINTGKTAVAFDRISLGLAWQPDLEGFRVEKSYYVRGRTLIPFAGTVKSPEEPDGDWSYEIVSRNARILPNDVSGAPMDVGSILVKGRAKPRDREVFFDRFALRAATAKIDGAGSVKVTDEGPYLALALESEAMPVATMKRIWPITFAPPARAWVIDHIQDGRVEEGKADISLGPGAFDPDDPDPGWSGNDVRATVRFSDLGLTTIGTVPKLKGVAGSVVVANEVLTISGDDGRFDPEVGETVQVPKLQFEIPNFRERDGKIGQLEIAGEGGSIGLGSILDSEPFRALAKQDVSPEELSGSGNLLLKAEFPLEKDIDFSAVDWRLEGELDDFSIAKPVKGRRVEDATLSFAVDPVSFAVTGRGRLDGLSADIDIFEPLGEVADGAEEFESRQGFVLNVSAKDLKNRGIDLGSMVSGPMKVSLQNNGEGQLYEIDLTNAQVAIEQLGWTKSAGVAGTAQFEIVKNDDGQTLKDFRLNSEGVEISGTVQLSPNGELREARFGQFKLRASDAASLTIAKSGSNAIRATLKAKQFDGRGLIAAMRGTKKSEEDKDSSGSSLSLNADIGLLLGFNGVSARDVKLDMRRDGTELKKLKLSGLGSGKNAFDVSFTPGESGGYLTGTLANTGETLRFLDVYKRMRGGRGNLSVEISPDGKWAGNFTVDNLSITEDPAIKQLSTLRTSGAEEGRIIRDLGAARRGEASFQRMTVAFRRNGDVINVTEGTLTGPTVGGTFTGHINLARKDIDMTGTFVPAFALNNLFAKIPVLGFALGGGSDEGLIGVTYQVTGPLSDPQFSINPVSAIAPGIFRKLFEYR